MHKRIGGTLPKVRNGRNSREDNGRITRDEQFESLLWPLTDAEYAELERLILADGCRDKLIVWRDGSILVDGHNRHSICQKHGIPFEIEYRDFASRDDVLDFIDRNQAARRNCTPEQYRIISGRIYNRRKNQGKRSDLTSDQIEHKLTADAVASELGLSAPTVRRNGQRAELYDSLLADGYTDAAESAKRVPQSVISSTRNQPIAIAAERLAPSRHTSNTGEVEWYTPKEYVEMVRLVMGEIDLDPASCKKAQRTVKAVKFYDAEQDGLLQDWSGRIYMNPPYKTGQVERFTDKLIESLPNIKQAIALVNNGTETRWFQKLLNHCDMVCFPNKRIAFINSSGDQCNQPNHGQAFFYIGNRVKVFCREFSKIGTCLTK